MSTTMLPTSADSRKQIGVSSMNYLYEALDKPARLYIKQCPHCGLKYFGKSIKEDIEKYEGSGRVWSRHLKKYGVNPIHLWNSDWYYDTSIIRFATKFSNLNKIVESKKWANLIIENGINGGDSSHTINYEERDKRNFEKYGVSCVFKSQEVIDKMKSARVKKYGVEWASQSPEIQIAIKTNNLQKYGVDNPNKLERRKEEVKNHNLELSNREIVKNLRLLKERIKVKELGNGWYKKPTSLLEEIYSIYVE